MNSFITKFEIKFIYIQFNVLGIKLRVHWNFTKNSLKIKWNCVYVYVYTKYLDDIFKYQTRNLNDTCTLFLSTQK